ncbi:MAG: rhomboid family intramembrane serine protease [Chloroflexota bacterium]|nr:MAG: rhomboid family intramembrane serine protease [Chloroflexota bacterium]
MLPLSDVNPTRRTPVITYLLLALNIGVFVLQLGMSERELLITYITHAVVPSALVRDPFSLDSLLDMVRSMFFHGGWLHLLSNMLYLWIFGDNVEDRLGKLLYILLYFGSGFAAIWAQVIIDPTSRVPLVGASGAIAGVLGAYAHLFPRASVRGLVFFGFFAQFMQLPALLVLGFWFISQLFSGVASLGVRTSAGGGVAFFAHIGGFVFGFALAWLLSRLLPPPPPRRNIIIWP